jgi:hypothetical protein
MAWQHLRGLRPRKYAHMPMEIDQSSNSNSNSCTNTPVKDINIESLMHGMPCRMIPHAGSKPPILYTHKSASSAVHEHTNASTGCRICLFQADTCFSEPNQTPAHMQLIGFMESTGSLKPQWHHPNIHRVQKAPHTSKRQGEQLRMHALDIYTAARPPNKHQRHIYVISHPLMEGKCCVCTHANQQFTLLL